MHIRIMCFQKILIAAPLHTHTHTSEDYDLISSESVHSTEIRFLISPEHFNENHTSLNFLGLLHGNLNNNTVV